MEKMLLNKLDSMLARALLDKIKQQADVSIAIFEHIDRLRKLSKRTPSAKQMLREAIDYVVGNLQLSEDEGSSLRCELNSLGGPLVDEVVAGGDAMFNLESTPVVSSFDGVLQSVSELKITQEKDPWRALDNESIYGFLSQINPIDGRHKVEVASSKVWSTRLSFYSDVLLVRVLDSYWENPDLFVYYLAHQESGLYRLNGTSPPIHQINAKAKLQLTENNITDYLKFFCFFVRGEEGPFYVVESTSDSMLDNVDETTLSCIEKHAYPVDYKGKDDQGRFLCDAVVFYSNALFTASFEIQPSGMVEMKNDKPLAGDLIDRLVFPIA